MKNASCKFSMKNASCTATALDAEQPTFCTALLKAIISLQPRLSRPYADPRFANIVSVNGINIQILTH